MLITEMFIDSMKALYIRKTQIRVVTNRGDHKLIGGASLPYAAMLS